MAASNPGSHLVKTYLALACHSRGFDMSRGSFTQSSDPYWAEKTHEFLIENNSLTNHFPGLSKEKYVPTAVLAPKDVYLNALTSNQSPKCPAEEDH